MCDCGFVQGNKWFRYRAAAIIVEDGCVLFVGNESANYYYSVGGGVHLGETAEDAVLREVQEETGVRYEIDRLAIIHENFFRDKRDNGDTVMDCHEIAFYFLMKPRGTKQLNSNSFTLGNHKEEMYWLPIDKLEKYRAFPSFMKDYLTNEQPDTILHIVTDER